jgi:hypothetical protein
MKRFPMGYSVSYMATVWNSFCIGEPAEKPGGRTRALTVELFTAFLVGYWALVGLWTLRRSLSDSQCWSTDNSSARDCLAHGKLTLVPLQRNLLHGQDVLGARWPEPACPPGVQKTTKSRARTWTTLVKKNLGGGEPHVGTRCQS